MSFLDPTSAIVGAAAAIPALLALYLLKLRRRPVRVSSTLLWQSAAEDLQANVPLRWLRASWLLFLHLLIVGLLVAALGRPVLSGGAPQRSRVVLLIDRSASMSCREGLEGTTRLERAKERATELAERAIDSGAAVSVVSVAARAVIEAGFTTSRGSARAAIEGIAPTDQPGDLAAAVRVVDSLLADTSEERAGPRATVCLMSDGVFDGEPAPPPADAGLAFVPIGARGPDNAGIVALAARRDYDDPGTVRIFARVVSGPGREIDVPMSLSLDGEVIERRVLRLAPKTNAGGGEPETVAVDAGAMTEPGTTPSEAVTTFQIKSPAGGTAVVSIDRADALDADNSAAVVLPPARRAAVVLVKPANDGERPTMVPPWLLEGALGELDAASFRVISGEEYERAAAAGALTGFDLFVFDRVTPRTPPPAASLSFGAGMPVAGLRLGEAAGEAAGGYVLAWERGHPLLRDVALDQVFISRTLVPEDAGSEPSRAQTLATGPDGPLITLGNDGPHRRLVVAFDAAASNWPLQVSFPVFLASAVDFLTLRGEESAGRSFTTGQPVEVSAPRGASTVELRRVTAGAAQSEAAGSEPPVPGPAIRVAVPAGRAGERIPVGLVERAGVYLVEPAGAEPVVAVNLVDAAETACGVNESVKFGGATIASGAAGPVPREIWLWLVLGAAGLLVIEWLAFAWKARA